MGGYNGHISSFGETIELVAPDSTVIASTTTPSTPSLPQQFLRVTELMYHPADPTPDEIKAGCAEIQAGWTPEDEAARINPRNEKGKGRRPKRQNGWTPPTTKARGIDVLNFD